MSKMLFQHIINIKIINELFYIFFNISKYIKQNLQSLPNLVCI